MTPPQQQNPNELLSITREELERCCSQMSAAGYKVSANYVEASVLSRSRPATPRPPCEECIYQAQAAKAREEFFKKICSQCPIKEEIPVDDERCAESCEGCLTRSVYLESLRTSSSKECEQ